MKLTDELKLQLRALKTICAIPPDCWPGHGTLGGESFTITSYSAGSEMPLLNSEDQVEKLAEFIEDALATAHAEALLAAAEVARNVAPDIHNDDADAEDVANAILALTPATSHPRLWEEEQT